MVNTVHKTIANDDAVCFIISTEGESEFWWWEVSRGTWNGCWKDKNRACLTGDVMEWEANEFVNSAECSDCGCSCSGFATVEEANCLADLLRDIGLEEEDVIAEEYEDREGY